MQGARLKVSPGSAGHGSRLGYLRTGGIQAPRGRRSGSREKSTGTGRSLRGHLGGGRRGGPSRPRITFVRRMTANAATEVTKTTCAPESPPAVRADVLQPTAAPAIPDARDLPKLMVINRRVLLRAPS